MLIYNHSGSTISCPVQYILAFRYFVLYLYKIIKLRLKTALKNTIYPVLLSRFLLHRKFLKIDSTIK